MSEDFASLLEALRNLKAQGDTGFEGLIRDLLESVCNRTFRLLKSGPQAGKDILSDDAFCQPVIAIEAKRFANKTDLPLDQLKSKLRDAITSTPELDVWVIALTREMVQPDWNELQKIGREKGVSLLCLDWRIASGALPILAALCAADRHITENRLQGTVGDVLDRIEQHPTFGQKIDEIQRQLTTPEVGFDLARSASWNWLNETLQSKSLSRRRLRNHAEILGENVHYVSRSSIENKLTQWFGSEPSAPAVLLGDEGRGKSWTALSWCLNHRPEGDAPMILVSSAKDIANEDTDAILAKLLGRSCPEIDTAHLALRLKRWIKAHTPPTRILLLIDGLNEAWGRPWPEIIRKFDVEPWQGRVVLLLTSRTGFWRNDLLSLHGVMEQPITEVEVPVFNELELNEFLAEFGREKSDFSEGLLGLIRIPRFARLAVALQDRLRDVEDLTIARLVLEDWRARLYQRGPELRVDNEGLLNFVADLGNNVLNDDTFSISQKEIYARLSQDSGMGPDHYRDTISELVEGHWLKPSERQHQYRVNETLLPYAIGLDLARAVEELDDKAEIEDIIATYEEQLRGADIGVAILRAATAISFLRQKGKRIALKALLKTWIGAQNFFGTDFAEFWPLINLNPELIFEIAEEHWADSPIGYHKGETLAKGLANAAKWPVVQDQLVQRLPRWVGAFGYDPIRWRYGGDDSPDESRVAQTEANLRLWSDVESNYARKISGHLRADTDDYLSEAALTIMSFLPRAPFIETIVTWALTRAIMGPFFDSKAFHWLIRLNTEDREALEEKLGEEIHRLKKLSNEIATRVADILIDALAAPHILRLRSKESVPIKPPATHSPGWPRLNDNNVIVWKPMEGELEIGLTRWIERLAQFASAPHAILSDSDEEKLRTAATKAESDDYFDGRGPDEGKASLALARWAPRELGNLIRQVYAAAPDASERNAIGLTYKLAEVMIALGQDERDPMREQSLEQLNGDLPEDEETRIRYLRIYQNRFVAGLIWQGAPDQISALENLLPVFSFSLDLACFLTPLSTTDLEGIFQRLEGEIDDTVTLSWLGYLRNVKLPTLPDNADGLIALSQHQNETIRSAAIHLILCSENDALGTAFVDSDWYHYKGQSPEEAIYGTYLLASYGKHLPFDIIRERTVPQGLAYVVEARGRQKIEVEAAFDYTVELLDEEIIGGGRSRYGYPHKFEADDVWRDVIRMKEGLVVEKLRQAATTGKWFGFFNILPLVELAQALFVVDPSTGAEIWQLVKTEHHRSGLTIGDFDYLPFHASNHEDVIELRRVLLNHALTDKDLSDIANLALRHGHDEWLISTIEHDLCRKSAEKIARGLTLAGFLDNSSPAERLWCDILETMPFSGWLERVRESSRKVYLNNIYAHQWFEKFLTTQDCDEAFGFLNLFHDRLDGRHRTWANKAVDAARKNLPKPWLAHLDATAQIRQNILKKISDDRKKTYCFTRTVSTVSPWF